MGRTPRRVCARYGFPTPKAATWIALVSAAAVGQFAADARSLRYGRSSALALSSLGSEEAAVSGRYGVPRNAGTDVYQATNLLDGLKVFAHDEDVASQQRYEAERQRLTAALELTPAGSAERQALEQALRFSAEDRAESQVAMTEMLEYYYTAKAMLGSSSAAPDCRYLACGEHAVCKNVAGGARCECDMCFEGNGLTCKPVPCTPRTLGSAQPVRGPLPAGYPVVAREAPGKVEELQLAIFGQDQIAVVFRDSTDWNRGSLVVGRVRDMEVEFGFRQPLSTMASFGPVIAGLPNGRLLIGFRDAARMGTGYLMAARVNGTDAIQALLSGPHAVAHHQVEPMSLVAISASKFACFFADHTFGADGHVEKAWASVTLAEVMSGAELRLHGTYHFSQGFEVTQFAATALSDSSLVVAYRALPLPSMPSGQVSHELSALWIGLSEDELMLDPHPVGLEPNRGNMLFRDVALVSQDTFAYSYVSAGEEAAKMSVIHVDPQSHQMSILGGPVVLSRGRMRYLSCLSLTASGLFAPTTFTMFQRGEEAGMAETCRISPEGRIADCRDIAWADQDMAVISAGRLSDGRVAVAFADMKGTLLHQLLNAAETGATG